MDNNNTNNHSKDHVGVEEVVIEEITLEEMETEVVEEVNTKEDKEVIATKKIPEVDTNREEEDIKEADMEEASHRAVILQDRTAARENTANFLILNKATLEMKFHKTYKEANNIISSRLNNNNIKEAIPVDR